jgi:pyruvate dehydrogenase E2 component (dihydrolipoamide acetyltransferase)
VDLTTVSGTGPGGRITEADVEQAAASAGPGGGEKREPLSKMRRAIAKAMAASKQTIPHFYLSVDVDMTAAETWWKANGASCDPPLTLTDLIVKAAATGLAACPALNASLEGEDVILHESVNVGLAVGTDDGLLVPVLANASAKRLRDLAKDRKRAVDEARLGRLHGEARATFTISNLGMFGVREFAAIINPPEAGSLAVGAVRDEVRPQRDPPAFAVRRVMTMTLSADHRLVDGVTAARYLQDVRNALESDATIASWL